MLNPRIRCSYVLQLLFDIRQRVRIMAVLSWQLLFVVSLVLLAQKRPSADAVVSMRVQQYISSLILRFMSEQGETIVLKWGH